MMGMASICSDSTLVKPFFYPDGMSFTCRESSLFSNYDQEREIIGKVTISKGLALDSQMGAEAWEAMCSMKGAHDAGAMLHPS